MSSSQPSSEVTAWKRGDLVLVDGTREGAVVSVNGNMAQVSLWDAQAAAVNVSRLSPLEPEGTPIGACEGCGRTIEACDAEAPAESWMSSTCKARTVRHAPTCTTALLRSIADGPPQWLLRRDPLVQAVLADSLCFIACTSGLDYVTLAPTHKGLTLLETQE